MIRYDLDSLFILLVHCKEVVIITSYRAEMELEKIICMIPVTKMGTEPESPEPQLRIFLHNTHVSWKALSK